MRNAHRSGIGMRSLLIAAGMAAAAIPHPAAAESLIDALSLAYTNNPQLLAQRAQLRAIDEQVPQALSGYRPTVSGSASIGRSWTESTAGGFTSHGANNPKQVGVGFSQPIFRGFRTVADAKRAKATVFQNRALLLSFEQDILFQAVTAYMNVVRDQAVLRLNINNEQVLRRQLQATRDRFRVGEVTRTDVSQAEARLSRAMADRVTAEGNLQISRANYARVIGRMPGKLATPKQFLRVPKSLGKVVSSATRGAPKLVAARYAEKAARYTVDLIAGEFWPTVSIEGSVSHGEDLSAATRGVTSTGKSITAQVVIPLYSAGLTSSRTRQAKQIVSQRHQEIINARQAAIEAANSAWQTLQTARAQITAFRAAVRANAIALDGVRQEAAAGLRTVLDVLDAEQELLDSRVNLVRAERDNFVATFDVARSMGTLTAGNLKLPVEIYDVDKHYRGVKYKPWGPGGSTDSYAR
jgi:TolC family type I secretion outer membrane protein